MLTKKILKHLRKADKAKRYGDTALHNTHKRAAIGLLMKCKNVTEDDFHQVFDGAIITTRDTYWLVMHAKDQWAEQE